MISDMEQGILGGIRFFIVVGVGEDVYGKFSFLLFGGGYKVVVVSRVGSQEKNLDVKQDKVR